MPGLPPEQHEVGRFLERLAGRPPVETHISAVYVGAAEVWKLKKAVRFPFLDFTTIQARHHFLVRELELNKPAAPEIYRDVAAVDRDENGTLAIRPPQDSRSPLDWVLRMAPIEPGSFLDAVAARGALTAELQDALGDCVADHHRSLPTVAGWDSAAEMRRVAEGCVGPARAAGLTEEQIAAWTDAMRAELLRRSAWLMARAAQGCVRRCHGDLHLRNLCLWHGRPVPFDALEFDETLATVDVGYDFAFLLMDLEHWVGRPAANRVLNRYVARTGDAGLCTGLPAFLSLRAMIRAHVEAASGHAGDAHACLAAALAYLQPARAFVLAIGGLPGAGKSTLARVLAPGLGRPPGALVLRTDEIRKRQSGVAPEVRLPASAYAQPVTAAVERELVALTTTVAAGGHAVIADATFLDAADRLAVAGAARAAEVPFIGVWLTAPACVLEERIAGRHNDASDADVAVLRRALQRDAGPIEWPQIDATGASDPVARVHEILQAVLNANP